MSEATAKGIYWLASYPKSGNTWFRIVLNNVLHQTDEPFHLNHIQTGTIASSRAWIEQAYGIDSTDLTHEELDALRPAAYRWYSQQLDGPSYHKTHDVYTSLSTQQSEPLMPVEGCLGALYFIRNPLDVAISFAHHSQADLDEVIDIMADTSFAFSKKRHTHVVQMRQWVGSWSSHVESWLHAQQVIPVWVVRYEDMKRAPYDTFLKALQFLRLDPEPTVLKEILKKTEIAQLQQLERIQGFCEKPQGVKSFFRKGMVGEWQTTLTDAQVTRLIHAHAPVMRAWGYLDAHNHPLSVI